MSDHHPFPGAWYVLINWGPHPFVAGDPSIAGGLEKIALPGAKTREQAIVRAREIYSLRLGHNAHFIDEEGVAYPREPRIVYAEDIAAVSAEWVSQKQYEPLIVDHGISVAEAIHRCHLDGFVNPEINDGSFSGNHRGPQITRFHLLHPSRPITTGAALEYLAQRRLSAANLWELLAFAKVHPKLQLQFTILGLGEPLVYPGGVKRVLALTREGDTRCLYLLQDSDTYPWDTERRILAVRRR